MKHLLIALLSLPVMAGATEEKKETGKGVDVDRIECSWNKNSKEADEKCKPDPAKPTIAKKLDAQMNKDAKTLKNFFGIKDEEKK